MKTLLKRVALSALCLMPLSAFSADYVIDTSGAHASVNFKVSHLGYSYIIGRFNQFSGTFSYDPQAVEKSSVSVTVDTTSLDSNHSERDKHLRGSKFIDASKYSTATFVSKQVEDKGDGVLSITGDMTLHGVTRSETLEAHFIGAGKDPWGGERAGFEAQTRLQLDDYGIKPVGATTYVDLDIVFEGIKQ